MPNKAPTQERSRETLRKILNACYQLLQEKSFDEISMQNIANEAGVSVGNLYNRFKDRDALIEQVINNKQVEVYEALSTALNAHPKVLTLEKRIEVLTNALATYLKDLKPFFLSIASRQISKPSALPAETQGNTQDLVILLTDWLMLSANEVSGSDKHEKCAFAAGSIAFALQFDVIFGTASRTFGDEFLPRQIKMSHIYLTN